MKEERIMVDRRGNHWKKYAVYGFTAFVVIAAAILLVFIFVKSDTFGGYISRVNKALTPFIVGALFAYLMNPILVFYETKFKHFFYKHCKKISRANKTSRVLGIIMTVLTVILMIGFLLYLLIPQLTTTIMGIVNDMPEQIEMVEKWYEEQDIENTQFGEYIAMAFVKITDYVEDFVENRLLDTATGLIGSVASGVWSVIGTIYNILLGFIFAIYMLAYKENLAAISKKMTYAIFKRKRANTVVRITRACHIKFIGSITGKVVDSAIIGVLCFVIMTLFDIPYPPLISVIVGVTNVIPFFGPFIGAIPSAFLILFANPIKCLYFLIIIFVLQQFDGNILTPKIVGDSIGLSPLWVLFACTVFGSLWGVLGMLIGVPLMACIYMIVKEIVEDRLHSKGLMTETSEYLELDKVDETEMFCKEVEVAEEPETLTEQPAPDEEKPAESAQHKQAEASVIEVSPVNEPAVVVSEEVSEYVPATVKELEKVEAAKKNSESQHNNNEKSLAVITDRGKNAIKRLKGILRK